MHTFKTISGSGQGLKGRAGSWRSDLLILTLGAAVLFGVMLGSRPLSVPDEGRYVEIPREIVATGDWLTPRLNGVKYFEKPPLFYWFEAGLIELFGLSEWSVRLGPALFALFGCLAVWYAGSRMFGRSAGLLSTIVLATSTLYFALSRLITLDMPVTILLTAALLSFLLGTREERGSKRRMFFWGFYAFAALATLTKGLIGVVFPGMILFCWMLVTGEWRILRSMHLISGIAVFLIVASPWHLLVGRANPEFFNFYFVREHFQRYLTKVHHHYKPFWFFLPILLGGMLPWSAFLVQAVRHSLPATWADRTQRKDTIFLLLWAGLIFLFFSASSSKLIPYLLPVLPPLALLLGNYLADARKGVPVRGFGVGLTALGVLAAVLIVLFLIVMLRRPAVVPQAFAPYGFIIVAVLTTGIVLTRLLLRRDGRKGAIAAVTGTAVLFLVITGSAAPHLDKRTIKPLALTLKPLLGPDDEVVAYRSYYQDLPVYLERRITVVDWTGEMEFGTTVEDTSAWMIDEAEFRKRWRGTNTVYLLTELKTYDILREQKDLRFYPLARTRQTILACNKEQKP
jgi:4-amino-4-deoxy-L-arabinose transferase-like glycosyltransferase